MLGGSGAVGGAVVAALAERGVEVVFTFHTGRDRALELSRAHGARAINVDLSPRTERPRPGGRPREPKGRGPTSWFTRPASRAAASWRDLRDDDWAAMLAVNVTSALVAAQALAPGLAARGGGDLVFLGGLDRTQSVTAPIGYAATQGALATMTMALAKELGASGVRANLLALGILDQGLSRGMDEALLADYRRFSALRRTGTPAEVARAVGLAGAGQSLPHRASHPHQRRPMKRRTVLVGAAGLTALGIRQRGRGRGRRAGRHRGARGHVLRRPRPLSLRGAGNARPAGLEPARAQRRRVAGDDRCGPPAHHHRQHAPLSDATDHRRPDVLGDGHRRGRDARPAGRSPQAGQEEVAVGIDLHPHWTVRGKLSAAELEPFEVVYSDGATEKVVATGADLVRTATETKVSYSIAGALIEVQDNLEGRAPSLASGAALADLSVGAGSKLVNTMFVRADLRSLEDNTALAGQPPPVLLARGAWQLRLTSLSRLLPQETLRRDLFLLGIDQVPVVAAGIARGGIKKGESLVFTFRAGKGRVAWGSKEDELPGSLDVARTFLEFNFLGSMLAQQVARASRKLAAPR